MGAVFFCLSLLVTSPNLIFNGDFSAGATGFESDHKPMSLAENALFPEGTYVVTSQTQKPHLNTCGIANYRDHTTGDGNFLLVNGAIFTHSLVWRQQITGLEIGQTYRFTFWLSRWTPNGGPSAQLRILQGKNILAEVQDSKEPGFWEPHTMDFIATSTTELLEIRNMESASSGNDFALDDLELIKYVPIPGGLR